MLSAQVPLQTPGAPPAPPGSITGLSSGCNQMSAALVHAPEGEIGADGVFTGAIVGCASRSTGPPPALPYGARRDALNPHLLRARSAPACLLEDSVVCLVKGCRVATG